MQNKRTLKAICKARLIALKSQQLTIALLRSQLKQVNARLLVKLAAVDQDKLYSVGELREILL